MSEHHGSCALWWREVKHLPESASHTHSARAAGHHVLCRPHPTASRPETATTALVCGHGSSPTAMARPTRKGPTSTTAPSDPVNRSTSPPDHRCSTTTRNAHRHRRPRTGVDGSTGSAPQSAQRPRRRHRRTPTIGRCGSRCRSPSPVGCASSAEQSRRHTPRSTAVRRGAPHNAKNLPTPCRRIACRLTAILAEVSTPPRGRPGHVVPNSRSVAAASRIPQSFGSNTTLQTRSDRVPNI